MCCTNYNEDHGILTCSICKDCYHLRCLNPTFLDGKSAELYVCLYCHFLEDPSIVLNEAASLRFGRKQPKLGALIKVLSDAENFSMRIEERDTLRQVVELALECKVCSREVLDFELSYLDKDLNLISKKLMIALKATKAAGVYDHQGHYDLELALARDSWRVKAKGLLDGVQKPTMELIRGHMKEGLAIKIPPKDYFRKNLTELNQIGLQWADCAKKVVFDSGALGLDKVMELILEGENLPIYLEKELKLLRARSLYCICRKPCDNRAKVTCDQFVEWYHLDCIKLQYVPKVYVCAACDPLNELCTSPPMDDESNRLLTSTETVEPKTSSPRPMKSTKRPEEVENCAEQIAYSDSIKAINRSGGIDRLWWRNRKCFRREAKKQTELDNLSPLVHLKQSRIRNRLVTNHLINSYFLGL